MRRERIVACLLAVGILTGMTGCGNNSTSKLDNKVGKSLQQTTAEKIEETTEAITEAETEVVTEITTELTTIAATTETTAVTEVTGESEVTTATLTDASGSFTYTGELKWIGDEEHGYIQVPTDYMIFKDVDAAMELVQYCYGPYNIVTLQRFEGTSADTAAQNLYAALSTEENCERLEGAEVPIAEFEAKQLYAYYADTMQYLVIWLIPDPDDSQSCYYLAMEFTEDMADLVACSSTFTPHRN